MTAAAIALGGALPCQATPTRRVDRPRLHVVEDLAVSAVIAAMVVVPLAEIVLRRFFDTGISGAALIVQHLALFVGMFGGVIAARDGRLLALSTFGERSGPFQAIGRVVSASVSATVTAFLAVASYQFVRSEQPFGKTLVYDVPIWVVELALPIGFAAIAGRLVYRASDRWRGRWLTAAVALTCIAIVAWTPESSSRLFVPSLVALVVATVLGAPAFVALGGTALVLFWWIAEPIAAIPVSHYALVTNPAIPTLPLFTLAGYVLAESGAPGRLIAVFDVLFGRFRGGAAIVTVVVCTFFTSFTGGSGITILALGGLLMPMLLQARYSEKDALGLVTGAGSLGMLLPPCLPLIVYAIVARVPLNAIFLGGLLPAMLMTAMTAWWGVRRGPKAGTERRRFDARRARAAVWEANGSSSRRW